MTNLSPNHTSGETPARSRDKPGQVVDETQQECPRNAFRASRRNARVTVSIVGYGTSGDILNQGDDIIVRIDRRACSPVLRQDELPTVTVLWWGNRPLSHQCACS